MSPRVKTAFVMLVVAYVMTRGVRDAQTLQGWPTWMIIPAMVLWGLSVWLLFVESRHPWGRR